MSQNQNTAVSFNIKSEKFIANSILALKKIYVPTGKKDTWGENKGMVMGLLVDFESYGYTFSHNLAYSLSHMDKNLLNSWGMLLVEHLKNGVAGVRKFQPMYPNFPAQVLNANEEELFLNSFMQGVGLWVGVRILPKYEAVVRQESEFFDKIPPNVLDVATIDDYERWVLRMLQANVSYSEAQKETISCFVDFIRNENKAVNFFSSLENVDIRNKENLSYWSKYVLDNDGIDGFNLYMANKFKVVTDVLRLVVAIGGGDTSLAGKLTVPKLSRAYRKLILSLVERVANVSSDKQQILENMVKYRSMWIRLAYACHVGEYKNSYPAAFSLLQEIREMKNFIGYNGMVERAYSQKDLVSLVKALSLRPGVFARSLSRLLVVEKSSYQDTNDRANRKMRYIKSLEKKTAHAKHLNERLKEAWKRKMKKAMSELDDFDESITAYVDNSFVNNPIADHLSRLGLASKNILEKDVNSFVKRGSNHLKEKTAETMKATLSMNGIDLPEPNYVPVPNIPKLEDLMTEVVPFEHFLLNPEQREFVLVNFGSVASKVSTPVLLQVHSFFKNIEKVMNASERYIMPKGGLSKIFVQRGSSAKFDLEDAAYVVKTIEEVLEYRFSTLPELGNVYIAPELMEQNIPFAQRSASKSLRTIARGSKLPVKLSTRTLRIFLWWMDAEKSIDSDSYSYLHGTDIDLSVTLLDKEYNILTECSFRNLREQGLTHSGDIRSAPEGACEFIDVNLDLLGDNVAYIVPSVHSYSGEPYCDLPECFAGWSSIEGNPQHGEIFDARAVKDRIDLSAKTGNVIPMFFDVKAQKMVWVDTAFGLNMFAASSLTQRDLISQIVKMWNEVRKPSLYDLFMLHAKARGTLVENIDEADSVFSLHEGLTPFDFEIISSEYMSDVKI